MAENPSTVEMDCRKPAKYDFLDILFFFRKYKIHLYLQRYKRAYKTYSIMRKWSFLFRTKGYIRRWYRKTFHRGWNVVEHGSFFFQEFADLYGDSVNDLESAAHFFDDFMKETRGQVIIDFLDADNWDYIEKIDVDKNNGLIWFYWRMPSDDPFVERMKRMISPFQYYGMCLKFDNVRFVRNKRGKYVGICVNSYTIKPKSIRSFANNGGELLDIDTSSSFFSTNLIRKMDEKYQYWRFIDTPICSFWIIPKTLGVHPQDSEKLLYWMGVKRCEADLKEALRKTKHIKKLDLKDQRRIIKSSAQEMRIVAESLFKLIMCFYQEQYKYKFDSYDAMRLKNMTVPLKKSIYSDEIDQARLDEIPRLANDLSHDSGNPVDRIDVGKLFLDILYFVDDFKSRIRNKGLVMVSPQRDKPDPEDYVKEHYKEFCFLDEINELIHKSSGRISYRIRASIGTMVRIFPDRSEEVLCADGYIRPLNVANAEALLVWDRTEVITLLEKMHQKVEAICADNGFDVELDLGVSFEAILEKEGKPCHLFTEKEIEDLMRNADDSKFNKLVIDEDGYAHIIQNFRQGYLYPVSLETWDAYNMYVGEKSSLSDAHDSYVLCMHLWLAYLKSGLSMYDDLYRSDKDLGAVIQEVKTYY